MVVAACLGIVLLAKQVSPVEVVSRPTQPVASVAVSHPLPAATPLAESETEFPPDEPPPQKRNPRAVVDLRNTFRAQIRAAKKSSDPGRRDLVSSLLAQWVQQDPAGAGRFARSLPTGEWRQTIVRQVAQNWARQDGLGAEKWAARLPEASERNLAETNICFQVVQTDARQALEIAERQELLAGPGEVMGNLVQQWAERRPSEAAAWINQQPEGEQRDQMIGRFAYVQSQTEPAAAANLVMEQIPPGPIQEEAAITVLHQWGVRDMASATAWVNQFPPGALRDRAEAELQGLTAYSH